MLAYQFEQGIPVDEWAAGESSENVDALKEMLGDTVDLKEFEGAASAFSEAEGHGSVTFGPGSLYGMREALAQELGADGDSIITSRAICVTTCISACSTSRRRRWERSPPRRSSRSRAPLSPTVPC